MSAVWIRARSELRHRWRATAMLVLLVGLLGGVSLAGAAGARRTASAYPRFREASNSPDILVNPDLGSGTRLDFAAVAALPQVRSLGRGAGFVLPLPGPDGKPALDASLSVSVAPVDEGLFVTLARPKVLAGRLPDPARADEAYVNQALAKSKGLRPGDHLTVYTAPTEELSAAEAAGTLPAFETRELAITGVAIGADEVVPDQAFAEQGSLVLTPAFYREHQDRVIYWGLFVDLENDAADALAFREAVERLAGDEALEFQTASSTTATVQRALRPQAAALAIFAALAGLGGILVAAQALGRQLGADAGDGPALHAMGMTRRQRFAVALLRIGLVALGGAALAALAAAASSPLFPIGRARLAEPDVGVSLDPQVLGLGAGVLVALLVAYAAVPAWRGTRVRPPEHVGDASGRPSRLAGALARSGMGPAAVIGVKLALEPGRGRSSVPTRSTLVGSAVAVAGMMASLTFAAGLDRLLSEPRLYGWSWDAMIQGGDGSEDAIAAALDLVANDLSDEPAVSALSTGNVGRVVLAGTPVPGVGIDPVRGLLSPTIVQGRALGADDEIALGSRTLDRAGLSVGDVVAAEVHGSGNHRRLRVVGQAVFPNFATYQGSDNTDLGEGALVTTASLRQLGPTFTKPFLLVDVAEGAATSGFLAADRDGLLTLADDPQLPADVVNLDRVRQTPMVLAALLSVLAFATVTHTLVTSVRRRRRDLAVIRALGFLRRQVLATVAWQATTVAVAALLAGLPAGIAAGRWAWMRLAEGLGIPPEPVTPLGAVVVAVPAVLAAANVVAIIPAIAASRIRPATALRSV